MTGEWENGQITKGQWVLQNSAVYDGEFKLGRPYGAGKFTFQSGLTQSGAYIEKKKTGILNTPILLLLLLLKDMNIAKINIV